MLEKLYEFMGQVPGYVQAARLKIQEWSRMKNNLIILWDRVLQRLTDFMESFLDFIDSLLAGLNQGLTALRESIVPTITDLINQAYQELKQAVTGAISSVFSIFTGQPTEQAEERSARGSAQPEAAQGADEEFFDAHEELSDRNTNSPVRNLLFSIFTRNNDEQRNINRPSN